MGDGKHERRFSILTMWSKIIVALLLLGSEVMSEKLSVYLCDSGETKNEMVLEVEDANGAKISETFRTSHQIPTCNSGEALLYSNNFTLLSDGHLVVTTPESAESNERKDYFYPGEFCVELKGGQIHSVQYCSFKCTPETPCIQKCCDHTKLLKLTPNPARPGNPFASECVPPSPESFKQQKSALNRVKTTLHHHLCSEALKEKEHEDIKPHYFSQIPKCKVKTRQGLPRPPGHFFAKNADRVDFEEFPVDPDFARFRLLKNGSGTYSTAVNQVLTTQIVSSWFCTHDFHPESNKTITEGRDLGIVFCRKDFQAEMMNQSSVEMNVTAESGVDHGHCMLQDVKSDLYPPLFFIASFFLFLSLLVYILLWKKQNIHGWTVAAHIMSLLVLNFFFAVSYLLYTYSGGSMLGKTGCVLIAVILHFFFLSTFSWLTMINVNLWWTFRTMQVNPARGRISRRLIIYNVISWGIPLLVVMAGLIQDFRHKSLPEETGMANICMNKQATIQKVTFRPSYGEESCYIKTDAQFDWIYYPISALMATNVILFGMTAWALLKHRCSTNKALKGGRSTAQNESFTVFAKLIVVMGLTWTLEFLSKAIEDRIKPNGSPGSYGCDWYILVFTCDTINILRAIPIFLIFTCKRQVFADLYIKYPFLQGLLVCSKIPMCAEALNRERSMSHQMTSCYSRDTTLQKNGTINSQSSQKSGRSRSTSVVSSNVDEVISDQPC